MFSCGSSPVALKEFPAAPSLGLPGAFACRTSSLSLDEISCLKHRSRDLRSVTSLYLGLPSRAQFSHVPTGITCCYHFQQEEFSFNLESLHCLLPFFHYQCCFKQKDTVTNNSQELQFPSNLSWVRHASSGNASLGWMDNPNFPLLSMPNSVAVGAADANAMTHILSWQLFPSLTQSCRRRVTYRQILSTAV